MNLDLSSSFIFGDVVGLQTFFLDHRVVHEATASAVTTKYKVSASTLGLSSEAAQEAWARLMAEREGPIPDALHDWLLFHAQIHNQTFALIGGTGFVAPDISIADFSQPGHFYDWMSVHQQMHDYEQQQLGLS
jgi:hypothetical protein